MYGYRNINTGQVAVYREENARLKALNNWEEVPEDQIPASAVQLADSVEAERHAIEASAQNRLDRTKGTADGMKAAATARESSLENPTAPVPTLSTPYGDPTQGTMTSQLAEDPLTTVAATGFEENRRLAAIETLNPPTTGVLKRAKADQRMGRTQIGPDPQIHATAKVAAAKAEKGETASPAPPESMTGGAQAPGGEGGSPPETGPADSPPPAESPPPAGGDADTPPPEDAAQQSPPPAAAPKHEWVTYAVAQGATESEAQAMTKDQLSKRYGS